MITKDTAIQIANCYIEIKKAEALIKTIAEELAKDETKKAIEFTDTWGKKRGFELGIPSDRSTRILGVDPDLAIEIIERHIDKQKARLLELKSVARIELYPKSGKE